MNDDERDAKRYRWLKEFGYKREIRTTTSYSVGRGPFVIMELPSLNRFSKLALHGAALDEAIDFAMAEEQQP